jgi:WD40-like Beta Propeller Repeat
MRSRVVLFALLVVVCLAGAGAAIVSATSAGGARSGASAARTVLQDARADGRALALYRSLDREGTIAAAPAGAAAGERTLLPLACDRVHFAGGRGLCLARGEGFAAGYRAKVFGPNLRMQGEVDVAGVPSRARVSPDGRHGSVTLFVSGHSYAEADEFSTETTLIDLERGEKIANLEEFSVTHDGRLVTAIDVNFWGVTFARDGDRFYATMATGGRTYLIEGSISSQTARVIHENVECPSLSPDGTRVAYKSRTGSKGRLWRLTVLDLATMRETPLAELRSIDDQAEWLDDDRVLYGADGDVWMARADGGGKPQRFIANADSPAAVRW